MQNNGFLRGREIAAMVLIIVGIKLSDSTLALLAQKAQNGFWLIPIIGFVCIFPSFLILLYLLKKYKDKNLIEMFEQLLGKWGGKILGIILFLFALFTTTVQSRNYVEQIKLLYFPESPTIAIFFIFFTVAFFGAKRGIEVIGYTTWIGLLFVKLSAFLIVILVFGDVVFERIYPIFGADFSIVLKEGFLKSSMFGELIFFLIAYLAAQDTKMFRKGSIIAACIAILEITLYCIIYVTVFDYNSVSKIAFLFHDITQFINMGQYFTNIETIFMVFWLFAAFLKFIILGYIIVWIYGAVFHIRNFEPLLLPFYFIIGSYGLLPFSSARNELVFHDQLLNTMSPFLIIFPYILLLVAFMKGDLKK